MLSNADLIIKIDRVVAKIFDSFVNLFFGWVLVLVGSRFETYCYIPKTKIEHNFFPENLSENAFECRSDHQNRPSGC